MPRDRKSQNSRGGLLNLYSHTLYLHKPDQRYPKRFRLLPLVPSRNGRPHPPQPLDAGCVLTVQFQGRTIEFSVWVVSFSVAISQHNHGHPANELSVGNTTALTRNDKVLFKSKGETQPINGFFAILVSQSRHYSYLHIATLVLLKCPWGLRNPKPTPLTYGCHGS